MSHFRKKFQSHQYTGCNGRQPSICCTILQTFGAISQGMTFAFWNKISLSSMKDSLLGGALMLANKIKLKLGFPLIIPDISHNHHCRWLCKRIQPRSANFSNWHAKEIASMLHAWNVQFYKKCVTSHTCLILDKVYYFTQSVQF